MTIADTANRVARPITWISVAVIVVAIAWLARALPVDRALEWIETWIAGLGVLAPMAFAVIYAVAVVLLLPGSVLTLAAGALFGLGWGVIAASLGSTTGAALAFLIARRIGRERFARMIERHPRFRAVDTAIGDGGWKVVAMLRLTPMVPFSFSNYLFGLTPVGFVAYVLASWLFMLPGTFMWVYFGHVGGEGLAAASGADGSTSTLTWVTRLVALAATVAVIVYVTARARRALKQQTDLPMDTTPADTPTGAAPRPTGWPWSATAAVGAAAILLGAAAWAWTNRTAIRGRFGAPTVVLAEAYPQTSPGQAPPFDHSGFDALLKEHVDADGWVDYDGLRRDAAGLDTYLAAIADAPFDTMSRDEKLALLINAYNAATLRLILDFDSVKSIKDIPADKRWAHRRWNVGGNTWSLDDIEHEQIRPRFNEPRIHFALVCAAVGCPTLRNEAYDAGRLDAQLADQMLYAHGHDRWLQFDAERGVLELTRLYNWYGTDFTQSGDTIERYVARYSPALKQALDEGRRVKIKWLEYSWKLNSRANAP